jgi:haloalkane dehalogenase
VNVLRTPEERFAGLTGFDYEPGYVTVGDGLRMAYVAAGPVDGPVVVLSHGEPTWSYLYRSILPVLAGAGIRAVAPDLIGFGRSDKPTSVADYTYDRHVEWLRSALFDALDLHDVTYVAQDWGGLLGLRLVAAHPERFAGVVATNTGLPVGDAPMSELWQAFRTVVATAENLDVGWIVDAGCARTLGEEERAAYDAPFPDDSYKAGVRAFPELVPTEPDSPDARANRAAWAELARFDKPFLCAFSDSDPITSGADGPFRETVPGATGQPHTTLVGGSHFVQEDCGPELAAVIVEFVRSNGGPGGRRH